MFAIATPQTVTLTIPGDDAPSTLINFRTNDADTSRCVLEIVTPEGDTHRLTFNVRGQMVDSTFTGHDAAPDGPAPVLGEAEYIVDGVDTRAFNPYTHKPPATADSAYQPQAAARKPDTAEERELRELREQHYREAAERAKEQLDKHLAKDSEDPKDRADREAQERKDRLAAALDPDGAAKTPGLDRQGGLQDGYVTSQTFPNDETQRIAAASGKHMDGSPQANPDGEPMAPAPSSPLPGSPLPHPLDQPDPGKVNTAKDLAGA